MKITNVKRLNLHNPPRTLWAFPLIVLIVLSFAAYFPVAFNTETFNSHASAISHGRDHTHRHRPHACDEGDDITRVLKNGHLYLSGDFSALRHYNFFQGE